MTEDAAPAPPPLLAAALLVAVEGLLICVLAVLEVLAFDSDRAAVAVTTALFFLAVGAGLLFCSWGLGRVRSWARGPVVAVQLLGVLTSFSFWGGQTTWEAVVVLLVSLAVLVTVLHPASTRALAARQD